VDNVTCESMEVRAMVWLLGIVRTNAPAGKKARVGVLDASSSHSRQPVPLLQQLAPGDPSGG